MNTHEARELLLQHLQPGDIVFTVLRYTDEKQYIKCYVIPRPICITEEVARVIDCSFDTKHDAMGLNARDDAEFQLVQFLSQRLFGNETALRQERL